MLNQYLRTVKLCRENINSFSEYPFSLEAVRNLFTLDFHPKVTFIVGENGTGKSTILEAIATAYGFNPEGGTKNFNFSTKETHSELYKYLKLIKGVKMPEDGFFLRAESFYNVATKIDELDVVRAYGGVSLHDQSHGESFISLFINKFRGNSLYILDEPEAALSPTRQMTMVARMHELVEQGSQFVIATHSPIIMSYPHAVIYELKDGFKKVIYKDTEHFQVMKQFVNNTEKMLDILINS
ncbi:AAA family ATPase [Clostridium sp. CX1]|uniref:AAA family ATPase n=1 Tax=Clostridium tanneri TaxID=3037988 RepID=A0ABU4JQ75_9CLOT|nr:MULTISPECIES: AAA family ATPase [unclassified Clostridium]MCT8977723.1 AAA family ATPase [Clostridium sp. CX1]MDW8800312.1 AAA family ATPase [Clostridium sp. A1-XYC3]